MSFKRFAALVAALFLLAAAAVPAAGAGARTPVDNRYANDYAVRSAPMTCFLYEDGGAFCRVQATGDAVAVETYAADATFTGARTVAQELPLFGGFFDGAQYRFLVFGQENPDESNDAEVLRVVKYDKTWRRLGAVSVRGANTNLPFRAGSLRMTETGGRLYVQTCHRMFRSSDGLNHQANMTFEIDEADMTLLCSQTGVANLWQGYVSHSFNQFIATDGDYIYRADHGDAYPRAISLTKSNADGSVGVVTSALPIPLDNTGDVGANETGASLGGFALTDTSCLLAGNAVDYTRANADPYGTRNIFVAVTDKELIDTEVVWLTAYADDSVTVGTPQLTKLSDDRFLLLWSERTAGGCAVRAAVTDGDGKLLQSAVTTDVTLSDCAPVLCSDGSVRWFVSDGEEVTLCVATPGKTAPRLHGYSAGWSGDNTDHWHACACGAKSGAAAHTFGAWKVTRTPSCTAKGERSRTCTVCGRTVRQSLAATGHSFEGDWVKNDDSHWRLCSACGGKGQTAAHTYGKWTTVKAATATAGGSEKQSCTVCGYTRTRSTPAAGYSDGWHTVAGKRYYYRGGQPLKGKVTVDGKTYILSKKTGALLYGQVKCDGKTYITNKKTGVVMYGKVKCDGKTYITNKKTGVVMYGKVKCDGKTYVTNKKTGAVMYGKVKCDDKTYVTNKKTGVVTYGKVKCDGKTYITNKKTGAVMYGKVKCDGKTYIANKKTGVLYKNGWVTCDGRRYYVNAAGVVTKQK